jgi:hypothetical protein
MALSGMQQAPRNGILLLRVREEQLVSLHSAPSRLDFEAHPQIFRTFE